ALRSVAQVLRDGDSEPVFGLAALAQRDRSPPLFVAPAGCRLCLFEIRPDRTAGIEQLIREPPRRPGPAGEAIAIVEKLAAESERAFAPIGVVHHCPTMTRRSTLAMMPSALCVQHTFFVCNQRCAIVTARQRDGVAP